MDTFCNCKRLSNITIPDSVKIIGGLAFDETKWMKNQQKKSPLVIVNKILLDGTKCSGHVVIPNTVKKISGNAFNNCETITSVIIPSKIKAIEYSTFENCTNLSEVSIANGVETIGLGAFQGCKSLKNVILPVSIKRIDKGAFTECENLKQIIILSSQYKTIDEIADKGVKILSKHNNFKEGL